MRRDVSSCLSAVVVAALALSVAAQLPDSAMADTLTWQKVSSTSGGTPLRLHDFDYFGDGIAALGDANGDGKQDLAVGNIFADANGKLNSGGFWILSLNASGAVVDTVRIDDFDMGGALIPANTFGSAVAYLGDLDGPGPSVYALAVGASGDNQPHFRSGAVWILFFNSAHAIIDKQVIREGTFGFTGTGLDVFGTSIANLGDLDGPGGAVTTIAVTSPGEAGGCIPEQDRGALYLIGLNADGTPHGTQKIAPGVGGFFGDVGCNDFWGEWVCSMGDFDGSGPSVHTIAVGAIQALDNGVQHGAVWLLRLRSDLTVLTYSKIGDGPGGLPGLLRPGDRLGISIGARDLDGDGTQDLLVGNDHDDDGGTDAGALWALYLQSDGTVRQYEKISGTQGGFVGALAPVDLFGSSIAFLGDLNGDGREEVAVGANTDDDGGTDRGAVYILSLPHLGVCCFAEYCAPLWEWTCAHNGGAFQGLAVSCTACGQPPVGACCFGHVCFQLSHCACDDAGGVYLGNGTSCIGACQTVDVQGPPDPQASLVSNSLLGAVTPNPSAGVLFVNVRISAPAAVRLELFDVSGRLAGAMQTTELSPGEHSVAWSSQTTGQPKLASGVYLLKASVGGQAETKPVVIVH